MLAMPALRDSSPEVLAATDELDRPVRWVHVLEINDALSVLEGAEVVLTTGMPLTGSVATATTFVEDLARSGACGLVVELGPRLPVIDPEVVRAADVAGLPLVALHREVRFVAITEAVHRVIVAEQYEGLELSKRTHEAFTTLALESADAGAIVARTSELIGTPVVLEDLRHRVLALAGGPEARVLDRWEERSRAVPLHEDAGRHGTEQWLTCSVGTQGAPWGRLVAPGAGDVAGRGHDVVVLQRAAQALQISRLVDRDRTDLRLQVQESLLHSLADGRVTDEREALARSSALGVSVAPSYVPAVVSFGRDGRGDEISRRRRERSLVRSVAWAVEAVAADGIVGSVASGAVGVVLAVGSETDGDRVLRALARHLDESHRQRLDERPVIGAGAASTSLLTAAGRTRPLVHVAEAGRSLSSSRPYYRSTDVRLRGLVTQLRDDERLQAFAEAELGPLLELPEPDRSAALDLLRTFVTQRGSKTATGRALGISRPAVYARLARLERRLSISLDEWESVLSVGVALMATDARPDPRS